ncbi:Rieske (2Fe-2S) protein [Arthrobacter sp. IA7]|uniref:Rieske (2Fe-2S) protein n=1 Tax=Arthrobacter ipis TaxID=2716202 RepID=UPI0016864EAC|nr:Rieske (2Fe-2S) protein [Arthrobacter ipis]MBD1543607.1 Rieske (2Fe-2S) protein [Arthrobacter ipis]
MNSGKPLPRRFLLLGTAATTAGGALSACSVAPTGSTTVPAAPDASAPPGHPFRIGKLSDINVGDTATGKANGRTVVVFRPEDRKVVAYDATCTHAGCTVAPVGTTFECPCHGSTFNGSDGSVVSGPARRPLTSLTAAIDGDWITILA